VQTLIADFDSGKFNKGKTKEEFDAALAQHKTAAERRSATMTIERDTALWRRAQARSSTAA
jgi:urate oxidase